MAAINGTREMGLAVSATTLTTIIVFLPIVFVDGVAGQVFRDQALAICWSLTASWIVSVGVVPMLTTLEVAPSQRTRTPRSRRPRSSRLADALRRLGGLRGRRIRLPRGSPARADVPRAVAA
jgi:HAE1 family hydrophobic/amphiphilic exporter-1